MKKELFRVEATDTNYDTLNNAIFEDIGEQNWYSSQKDVNRCIKDGELEFKNGMAIIYDID